VYFRFTAGLLLAMAVSMAGTWLEKQSRLLHREISLQHYHADVLREFIVRKRLEVIRLSAPRTAEHVTPTETAEPPR
jgi:hypothetical protein